MNRTGSRVSSMAKRACSPHVLVRGPFPCRFRYFEHSSGSERRACRFPSVGPRDNVAARSPVGTNVLSSEVATPSALPSHTASQLRLDRALKPDRHVLDVARLIACSRQHRYRLSGFRTFSFYRILHADNSNRSLGRINHLCHHECLHVDRVELQSKLSAIDNHFHSSV